MGQDVQRLFAFLPLTAVEVVAIFGQRGQIYDAEETAVVGPCVSIVGRRLT